MVTLVQRLVRVPLRLTSARATFRYDYRGRCWGGGPDESASGPASSLASTEELRLALPALLRDLGVRTLLDAPCGDFFWMSRTRLSLDRYIGADIVPELIDEVRRRHGAPGREFIVADLTRDRLPVADAVLCRDCLTHLSLRKAAAALENIRRGASTYLLATTFPGAVAVNRDILTGGWRMLDLRLPPFNLPAPIRLLDDWSQVPGRKLGVWRTADLPAGSL